MEVDTDCRDGENTVEVAVQTDMESSTAKLIIPIKRCSKSHR